MHFQSCPHKSKRIRYKKQFFYINLSIKVSSKNKKNYVKKYQYEIQNQIIL